MRKIQRLLFHVVAHLYHRHFRELLLLGLHGHLHGLFAHLILFNSRFRLIDDKETEILHDLVIALRLQPTDGELFFLSSMMECLLFYTVLTDGYLLGEEKRKSPFILVQVAHYSMSIVISSHSVNNKRKVSVVTFTCFLFCWYTVSPLAVGLPTKLDTKKQRKLAQFCIFPAIQVGQVPSRRYGAGSG